MSTKTQEKAAELADSEVFSKFKDATEISLTDAIRAGSSNTEKANGWGEGDQMCALHAARSATIAFTS